MRALNHHRLHLLSLRMSQSYMSLSRSPSTSGSSPKRRRLHSPTQKMPLPQIHLSAQEETVRRLLVDVGAEIDTIARTTGANKEPIVLRFTGGWVRDKLLGIPSHDIDVGINRMTGFDFGVYLSDFLIRHMHLYNIPANSVHKIESNPEKSKHLETATTKILGLDIDLVNLRSETYNGESRIPQMEFGTPVQDALRRDCTVNALFYNLHSQQVEDFTERGLQDMKDKLIRTPLPPYETFDDDPLRVLRLIRFSSRLGFDIIPEVKEAMQNPKIKTALRLKISRERVGTEIEKMLYGNNPAESLRQIHSLNLYTTIFTPPIDEPPTLPLHTLPSAIAALSHILTTTHPHIAALTTDPYECYLAWLIAALIPWRGATLSIVEKKPTPAAAIAAREGLKATNKVFDTVFRTYSKANMIKEEVEFVAATPGEWRRSRAGGCVKQLGKDWRSQVLGATLGDLVDVWGEEEGGKKEVVEVVMGKYELFLKKIDELGVKEAYNVKPIVDGTTMCDLFELKPGPWVAKALQKVLDWQWDNPEVGKEDAVEWVKENKGVLAPEGAAVRK